MNTSGNTSTADLQAEIQQLGPWFHNLHLPDGTQTAPDHFLGDFPRCKWEQIAPHLPPKMSGWNCLDIGCNAGFYSIELAKRGARVMAIDCEPLYLAQGEWAARQFGLEEQINFQRMQVYELAYLDGRYDMVIFMGLLHHLRYPMLGMDIVAQKVRRLMLFQTMIKSGEEPCETPDDFDFQERDRLSASAWPGMSFIEHRFAGDPTNWWVPNRAGVEAMLRSSGMRILNRIEDETYLCEPDRENPSCTATWNRGELLAATGRAWW